MGATYGGATASTRQQSVQNNYDMIRPVAHGLRLSSLYPLLVLQGMCTFVFVLLVPRNRLGISLLVSLKCRIWLGMLGIP